MMKQLLVFLLICIQSGYNYGMDTYNVNSESKTSHNSKTTVRKDNVAHNQPMILQQKILNLNKKKNDSCTQTEYPLSTNYNGLQSNESSVIPIPYSQVNRSTSYDNEYLYAPSILSSSARSDNSYLDRTQIQQGSNKYQVKPSESGYFSSEESSPYNISRKSSSGESSPYNISRKSSPELISFQKNLEFYDKFPKKAFHDSDINYEGWTEAPKDFYVTILLGRHVRDENNMNKTAHTSSSYSEINLETVGTDNVVSLMTLGTLFKFDAIAGGTTDRHQTTARLISSFTSDNQECYALPAFNEQKLGHLGGKSEKEILKNAEFIQMFNQPTYRIKTPDHQEDPNAETGAEVIIRFKQGIDTLISSIKKSRSKNLGINADELPFNNMFMYICSSRCTLNWMLRYFTGNLQLPLQLKSIQNCHLFCVNYFPNTGKFNMLVNTENMPYCISPLHFSYFALTSPVFHQFNLGFRQKASRIIKNQKGDSRNSISNDLIRTAYIKALFQSYEPNKKDRPSTSEC